MLYLVPLVLSYKLLIGRRVLIVKPDRHLIEVGPRDGVPSDQQLENPILYYSVVILLAVR